MILYVVESVIAVDDVIESVVAVDYVVESVVAVDVLDSCRRCS